jgi:hypothetical protein
MEMAINNLKKETKKTKPQNKTEMIKSYELRKTTNTSTLDSQCTKATSLNEKHSTTFAK